MAEGFLRSFEPALQVSSAGTRPAERVHPLAAAVMKEEGIDLAGASPKNVDQFLNQTFDFVITVCDSAKQTCPVFTGNVRNRLHIGFDDPAEAKGTEEQVLSEFRRVRDEIHRTFRHFYNTTIRDRS